MDLSLPTSPRIAVAFGGGGARGIAHIHIIEVLDELGIKPVAIAGSSIGSIVGAGMANGMSGKEIHEYMAAIFNRRSEVARRVWQTRPERWVELLKGGFRVSQFNIEKIIDAFLPQDLPLNVEDLKIPMSITAADFHGANELNIEEGDLRSAIAASCAIPPVFGPVRRDGRILVDGGLLNPVPFDLLFNKADIVIGIDVVGAPVGPDDYMPTTLEAVIGANQLTMCSIIENKFRNRPPHIFLRPNVERIGLLDFLKFEQILSQTAPIREELKQALDMVLSGKPAAAAS